MDRFWIAISSALIGVITTHLYTIFKHWKYKKEIITQLDEELLSIKYQLEKQLSIYEDAYKFILKKHIYPSTLPRLIVTPIYDEFFKEVLLQIGTQKRQNFQKIYHDVNVINKLVSRWHEEFSEQQKRTYQKRMYPTPQDADYVIELVDNSYINACIISWYISRFLTNKGTSIWDFDENINEDYKRQIKSIYEKIGKLKSCL